MLEAWWDALVTQFRLFLEIIKGDHSLVTERWSRQTVALRPPLAAAFCVACEGRVVLHF